MGTRMNALLEINKKSLSQERERPEQLEFRLEIVSKSEPSGRLPGYESEQPELPLQMVDISAQLEFELGSQDASGGVPAYQKDSSLKERIATWFKSKRDSGEITDETYTCGMEGLQFVD